MSWPISGFAAEMAATHQGILVSGIKLLMDEKDTSALSMDDDGPMVKEEGEGDSAGFWKQAGGGAQKANDGHGTIVLGANSPIGGGKIEVKIDPKALEQLTRGRLEYRYEGVR